MKILLLTTKESKVHMLESRHLEQIRAIDKSIELHASLAVDAGEVHTHLAIQKCLRDFPKISP